MCRLLAYQGQPYRLDELILTPKHSLVVQSYQPREMTAGLLNADGFGIGWYSEGLKAPGRYVNTAPIWNDPNLATLLPHLRSHLVLASVRSATTGLAVDLSNCQPYQIGSWLGMHNGFIKNFRQTLMRSLRQRLEDRFYTAVLGTTDSEHLIGLWAQHYAACGDMVLALQVTLALVKQLAEAAAVPASLNVVVSDGTAIAASRFAWGTATPTLYWSRDAFSGGIAIASEPVSDGTWQLIPEAHIVTSAGELCPI